MVLGYKRSAVIHGVSLGLAEGTRDRDAGSERRRQVDAAQGDLRLRPLPQRSHPVFEGEDISKLKPSQIVDRGIVHVPEGRRRASPR